MRSASRLVNIAFSSISATFLIGTVLYGALIGLQTASDRAKAEMSMTIDASALVVTNELFSGNLILAKERMHALLNGRNVTNFCLVIQDVSSRSLVFAEGKQTSCDSMPLTSQRVVYFDKAEKNPAFIISSGIAPKNYLKAVPFTAWCVLLGMIAIVIALNVYYQKRFQDFLSRLRVALRSVEDPNAADKEEPEFEEVGSIAELAKQARDRAKDSAVARMTGMLAHDVRKPFSILRMGLGMLGNAKDPAGVKRILSGLVPEIDKAVSSVDGLIADVMEVGSTSTHLIQEAASPESLIESTLGEIFRVYPKADINLTYELRHTHMANVHVQKLGRVFSNIVGNALQAMNYKGEIWFRTGERNGMIEFCVGNAGSVIPAESLPKLFDAFFTSGKKGGTGLGLAIAQKVVTAHGGKIWCESSKTLAHPDGNVEFIFILPVAEGHVSKTTAILPRHSSEIVRALEAIAAAAGEGSIDKGESTVEADVVQASARIGRPLKVLVVDDEQLYRSALASYLARTPELEMAVKVTQALNSREVLAKISSEAFDLIVTDVDMGHDSLDGFELVRELRRIGSLCSICVHSNRIVADDHKTAIESGANAFLPKPMARVHLLRLILQAALAAASKDNGAMQHGSTAGTTGMLKPEVLVVDDNPFVLDAWVDALEADAKVHVATSMASLEKLLTKDPDLINRLVLAVTDFNLDDGVADGADIGRRLKGHRIDLQVLLSSDGIFDLKEFDGAIDRVIAKDPTHLSALL